MNASTLASARLARVARTFRGPLVLWLVYECSKVAFFYLSRQQGLLQGVSVVNLGTLVFGVWLLVLRFAVLVYVPLAVVYRVLTLVPAVQRFTKQIAC